MQRRKRCSLNILDASVLYNPSLNKRIAQYNKDKKSDNYYAQAPALTQLKKPEDRIWLNEVNSQALQFALKSLKTAYVNFFRGKATSIAAA